MVVPLDALSRRIARDSLANLVFEAGEEGETQIELAGLQFCRPGGVPGPLPDPLPEATRDPALRALWVWTTRELLSDKQARSAFLEFVAGSYQRVFLHLPEAPGERAQAGFIPFDGPGLGRLVAELRERGALTYALDGDPSYVLPENHAGVWQTVRAIAAHNRRVPPEQRFHGVRYDVEPYLVRGWAGRRAELLGHYLDLIAGIRAAADRGDLAVGVDIPFWLDNPEPSTGQPLPLSWGGRRLSALDHIAKLVDDMAIMDYRTSVYGADGSLRLALGELEAAAATGARVYVGIETGSLLDEDLSEFRGPPGRGLPPGRGGPWVVLQSLDGGKDDVRVWWVEDGQIGELARELARRHVPDSALLYFQTGASVRVLDDRLSFRRLGTARLEMETQRLLDELGDHPAFAGLAFHHYGALLELTREPAETGAATPGS